MIENATNLTNATNITNVTNVTDGFISAILHSQEFWIALIVGVILLVGGIMFEYIFVWRPQRLKRLFDDVIIKNNGNTCEYPPNPKWLKYSQARTHLKIHGAWRLWKNVEDTKKKYADCIEQLYTNIDSIFVDRYRKEDFDGSFLADGRKKSSMDYVISKNVSIYLVDKNREANAFLERRDGDGKHSLFYVGTPIVGTTSLSTRDRLEALIESMRNDAEVKVFFAKRDEIKEGMMNAEAAFKKKLAKIVLDINYRAGARA